MTNENDDGAFIKHPPLPEIPPIFYTIYEKIKIAVDKLPKRVQNGFQTGFIFAIIPLFTMIFSATFNVMFFVYALLLFIIGTLLGMMFTAIAESMNDFNTYSRGQKTGIVIGFTFLFMAIIFGMMMLDDYVFQNTIFQFLLGLYAYYTTLSSKIQTSILESLKSGVDSAKNIKKPNVDFSTIKDSMVDNLFMLISSIVLCIILFFAARDTKSLTKHFNSYTIMVLIPIIVGFIILSPLFKTDKPHLLMFGGGIMALIFAISLYYTSNMSPDVVSFSSKAIGWLGLIIFIVGLAILVKLFSSDLKQMTGWTGFFANLLFYIPCLLNDFIDYIFLQFKTTPNTVMLLFVVEILLILFYVYYPTLMNKLTIKNETNLQKTPVFLNNRLVIANSDKMLITNPKYDLTTNTTSRYRTNYTIDMWIHLNIQPSSTASYANETTIFDYGDGKPRIAYKNSIGNDRVENQDNYLIYVSNKGKQEPITVSVPNQKWNYFAFNFTDSKVDIYINGALERSVDYVKNIPSYTSSDMVTVGSDDGLEGAICNINYYTVPLTSTQIATKYNVFSLRNPPL